MNRKLFNNCTYSSSLVTLLGDFHGAGIHVTVEIMRIKPRVVRAPLWVSQNPSFDSHNFNWDENASVTYITGLRHSTLRIRSLYYALSKIDFVGFCREMSVGNTSNSHLTRTNDCTDDHLLVTDQSSNTSIANRDHTGYR